MKYTALILFSFLLIPFLNIFDSYAQSTVSIMSYNVFNYDGSGVSGSRKTALHSVISSIDPDILIGIEIQDQTAANDFLTNVLNSSVYSVGFSPDALAYGGYDNYIFYKTAMFNTPTVTIVNDNSTSKWPTYKFQIEHISTSRTIVIYGVHLTSGSDNQTQREAEATAIRNSTASLGSGVYFIAVGDFNFVSSSSEGAYQILVDNNTSNYLIDPGGFGSDYYTFDVMNTFDKRYDFIFNSTSVTSGGLIEYNNSTFTVVGNTGGTTGSPYTEASDHLPVYADYTFNAPSPVELISFTGETNGTQVALHWRTETEVNNYGFSIERSSSSPGTKWETIGFIQGHGNSNSPNDYSYTDLDIHKPDIYSYRLKQTDNDGTFKYSNIVNVNVTLPGNYYLSQNYPNPFNPETKIDFTIPERQNVTLKVYNTLGEHVAELLNEEKDAGNYSVSFNASNLPSGIYIYTLATQNRTLIKKMTVLK